MHYKIVFEYALTSGELVQCSAQYNDVSVLKLRSSKHVYSELGHSPCDPEALPAWWITSCVLHSSEVLCCLKVSFVAFFIRKMSQS